MKTATLSRERRDPEVQGLLDFGAPLPRMEKPMRPGRRIARGDDQPLQRLFYALSLAPELRPQLVRQARALKARFDLRGRLRPAELLHVTLQGVWVGHDAPPEAVIAMARLIGCHLDAECFELVLDRAMSFKNGPFVACPGGNLEPLWRLQFALENMAMQTFPWVGPSVFTPHVTLLYDEARTAPETPLEAPIRWRVEAFSLIHGVHGERRHRELGRWPLPGSEEDRRELDRLQAGA